MGSYVLGSAPSFNINSKTRLGGDINNFTHVLQMVNNNNYDNVALTYCRIPKTYYLIDSRRNDAVFILDENGSQASVTVANGDYSIAVFMAKLVIALNAASPNGFTYAMSYPDSTLTAQTYKFTYTVTGNGAIQPYFYFASYSACIAKIMGFDIVGDYTIYNFSGSSLTSNKVIKMLHTDYVTIKSSLAVNEGNLSHDSSILAKIPVYSDTDQIEFTLVNLEDASRRLVSNQSNIHSFSLYDDDEMLLDLNGADWHCQIMAFKYNNASELIINDLKLKYLDSPVKEVELASTSEKPI